LERFFLDPGRNGRILNVEVSDEEIMDLFGTTNLVDAQQSFAISLPKGSLLIDLLAGSRLPTRKSGRPDYVRLLVFLCWVQVTQRRPRGMREFREIVAHLLGQRIQNFSGLNGLWDDLKSYLESHHNIELVLPNPDTYPQIGRTVRIAFPTWRNRETLRRIRDHIVPDRRLHGLTLANHVQSRVERSASTEAFWRNFKFWNEARERGDPDADTLPFWRAWVAIVSEIPGYDVIEISLDEYGSAFLSSVSPDGAEKPISHLSHSLNQFNPDLRRCISRGVVLMEDLGLGRYRSIEKGATRTLMVRTDRRETGDQRNLLDDRPLRDGWHLLTFKRQPQSTEANKDVAEVGFGWLGGIRIGTGSYLGRTPLTPRLKTPSLDHSTKADLEGHELEMIPAGDDLQLPDGIYEGRLTATRDGTTRSIKLLGRSLEHAAEGVYALSPAKEVLEDGVFAVLRPSAPEPTSLPSLDRRSTSGRLITIGEAIHARTVRGAGLREIVEIIANGLDGCENVPSHWQILRSFCDAGWFDLASMRKFRGHRAIQKPLTLMTTADGARGAVHGALPLVTQERLETCALASGSNLVFANSFSAWGLPRIQLEFESADQMREFAARAELKMDRSESASPNRGFSDELSLSGYEPEARWCHDSGYFLPTDDMLGTGVYRLVSTREVGPPLYAIVAGEEVEATFYSPLVALLVHAGGSGQALFEVGVDRLTQARPRYYLPSHWARWLSDRVACNPGPTIHSEGWRYSYAADPTAIAALQKMLPVIQLSNPEAFTWKGHFQRSRSRRSRHLHTSPPTASISRLHGNTL
tara:strand:+ start:8980 stop:11403 length:2424 start_codon:yes stop_codon:yes gene_type:complete